MLARDDLTAYIADHYGTCDRGPDCYHGTDSRGRFNGCLRVGWRGVECPHWHPVEATTWGDLMKIATNDRHPGTGKGTRAVKMKPCPKCGSADDLAVYSYDSGGHHVECNKCFYLGPGEGSTRAAIKSHNACGECGGQSAATPGTGKG